MNAMKKTRPDKSERDIYEMANEVVGDADTLDRNRRLVSVKQGTSNLTTESDNDPFNAYDDAVQCPGYDTIRPISQENPTSRPQISSAANRKRAARTAQHGDATATPDDGQGSSGETGIVYDSVNDITLVDNALYASPSVPAAQPAAAAAVGRTNEPICTSINDFTLVDNAIYNR